MGTMTGDVQGDLGGWTRNAPSIGCRGPDRTDDLLVMSQASFLCSTLQEMTSMISDTPANRLMIFAAGMLLGMAGACAWLAWG